MFSSSALASYPSKLSDHRHDLQKKPYTAVTVQIDRLTSPQYDENDFSGIIDLIEVIRIQDTGPTEAARAIRKKLKYGNLERQLRALTVLDGLIQDAGGRFQRTFADEPLLERLRMLPRDEMSAPELKQRCNLLFRQWAVAYKDTPGLTNIAKLHTQLPKRAERRQQQSKVLRETERQARENPFEDDEDEESAPEPAPSPAPASSSKRETLVDQIDARERERARAAAAPALDRSLIDKKSKKDKKHRKSSKSQRKPFDLEREKPVIEQTIAKSSMASTGLLNSLKLINREAGQTPSTDADASARFELCKTLRRKILRYIQHIESEQWIGSLLNANDELVKALMAFEVLEKGIDDDSDSEAEAAVAAIDAAGGGGGDGHARRRSSAAPMTAMAAQQQHMAALSLSGATGSLQHQQEETPPAKPPRPRGASLAQQPVAAATAPPPQPSRRAPNDSDNDDDGDDDDDLDEDNPFGDQNEIW